MSNGDDESWTIYAAVLVAGVVAFGLSAIYAIRHLC